MELKTYLRPALKWWWLIVVATIVATISSYFVTRDLPAIYRSATTLLIGRSIYEPNPTATEFGLNQQLAGIYAAIAQRDPVRQATMDALGLARLPDYDVRALANGQFIEIAVVDIDPRRAQAVAQELANQLVQQSPSGPQAGSQEREAFVNAQLDDLQSKIMETQAEIAAKQEALAEIISARELAEAQDEIAALQTRLTILQTNYANLLTNTEAGALNSLTVIEPAAIPEVPIGPNRLLLILLSAAGGFGLAVAAAYLLEYLDDTFRSSEDVRRLLDMPIMGQIGDIPKRSHRRPVLDESSDPGVLESFRSLRTNLEFAGASKAVPLKTILITSPGTGEGKTTVAANLALVMAQRGQRVVLVDADLRRPSLHHRLQLPNERGLSDVLRGECSLPQALQSQAGQSLLVLTAGRETDRSAELLASRRMDHLLATLEEMADAVILDGPPMQIADAWVLAAKASGVVGLVRIGYTTVRAAQAMREQLERVGARVLGLALNRVASQPYGYYGPYRKTPTRRGRRTQGMWSSERTGPSARDQRPVLQPGERPDGRDAAEARSALIQSNGASPNLAREARREPLALAAETPAAAELITTQRTSAAMDLLVAVSDDLASQSDDNALCKQLLRRALEGIGASSGSLVLLNEHEKAVAGAVAYAGDVQGTTLDQLTETVERGLAGWVVQHQEGVCIGSTRDDPRWLRRAWEQPAEVSRSALSSPIRLGERVVGVLTLVHPRPGQFTQDDLMILNVVAAYIAFHGAPVFSGEAAPRTNGAS